MGERALRNVSERFFILLSPNRPRDRIKNMAELQTQLLVLGGGPGGYPAAFEAADHGMQVTLVDEGARPGGVCLNRGCIPSKALLTIFTWKWVSPVGRLPACPACLADSSFISNKVGVNAAVSLR